MPKPITPYCGAYEFIHLVFHAEIIGGEPTISDESTEVSWFAEDALRPLSDGHAQRITFGFQFLNGETNGAYYE